MRPGRRQASRRELVGTSAAVFGENEPGPSDEHDIRIRRMKGEAAEGAPRRARAGLIEPETASKHHTS
jgi:hypothetical protein